ncbi:MAG TPA: DNA gyrase inhibitor YacG [Alphaproteobacteria bacterium]
MNAPKPKPRPRRPRCPICRSPAVADHAPFCSRRCADRDLARWLGGEYRIPTDEPPSPEDIEEALRTPPVGRA